MEARLIGDNDKDVRPGPKSSGELWLRGPLVMKYVLVISSEANTEVCPSAAEDTSGMRRQRKNP
jgi:hypothetical protein